MKFVEITATTALLASGMSVSLAQEAVPLPPVDVPADSPSAGEPASPWTDGTLARDRIRAAQSSSSDTAALLTDTAGVAVNTGGGFSSMPTVRGLTEQRLLITVDGQTIDSACPNDMNTPLSYTDPQTVAAVQVITGVSPVSLGGDSIGAVIAVESPAPRFAQGNSLAFDGEASAYFRSNDDGFGGALTLHAAARRFSATYTGSYTQADNYQGGGGLGTVHSSEFAKTDHALALAWQGAFGLLELKGGHHDSPYEGFVNQYMDMTSNRSSFVNGRYRNDFGWGTVDLKANYRAIDHEMNFLEDKGGAADGGMPMNTRVRAWGYDLKADVPLTAAQTLRLGNDFHAEDLDDWWPPVAGSSMMGPDTYLNINNGHRNRLGLFAEVDSRWSARLSSVLGARLDRVTMNTGDVQPYSTNMMSMNDAAAADAFNAVDHHRADNDWSASALLSYAATEQATLEAGVSHKTRAPNLYERYAWGRGSMSSSMIGWYGDGNAYVGNLALKPERADTVSLALDLHGDGSDSWSARLAPYYTHVDDYIDAAFLQDLTNMMGMPSGFVQLQFANQQARFYGVDVSAAAPLWDFGNAGRTRVNGTVAYVNGRNLTTNTPLYHQMPLNAKVALSYIRGAWEAGAETEWVAEKTRVDPLRNEPRTGSYTLLNLRAAYSWSAAQFTLDVRNLLDRGYSLPLGGISLGDYDASGGMQLRPVPGRGRSINAGVTVRF